LFGLEKNLALNRWETPCQYFLLKYLNFNKKNNKKWFMTLEETLINDIHKATK